MEAKLIFRIQFVLLAAYFAVAAALWPHLPLRVPIHFGASGQPTTWAGTSVLSWFGLPLLATVMTFFLYGVGRIASHAPELWNIASGCRDCHHKDDENWSGDQQRCRPGHTFATTAGSLVDADVDAYERERHENRAPGDEAPEVSLDGCAPPNRPAVKWGSGLETQLDARRRGEKGAITAVPAPRARLRRRIRERAADGDSAGPLREGLRRVATATSRR